LYIAVGTDHLQLTLERSKAEIDKTTSEILNQQKFIATEVTWTFSFAAVFVLLLLTSTAAEVYIAVNIFSFTKQVGG